MKKTTRQILAFMMAAVTALSLSACGGDKPAETTAASVAESADKGKEAAKTEGEKEESGEKKVLRVAMECAYAPHRSFLPSSHHIHKQTHCCLQWELPHLSCLAVSSCKGHKHIP